jgi:hypothetical protein
VSPRAGVVSASGLSAARQQTAPFDTGSVVGKVETSGLSTILCADWGKESRKRSVYVAEIGARTVRRLAASEWSVTTVLAEAENWTTDGSVLVTFDAPLGVPETYPRCSRASPVMAVA